MKDLIVVDFDKTLIPFDSFRKYVWVWFRYYPIRFSLLLILRKLRLISSKNLKEQLLKKISTHKQFLKINEDFANSLIHKIDQDVLEIISAYQHQNSKILLLSASPDAYIKIVGEKLKMTAQGSYFKDNQFFHLHGKGKLNFIQKEFPKDKFNYAFAVSDSESDMALLSLFQNSKLKQ